jgi:predicted GIY-YIG superfamily endonuclease
MNYTYILLCEDGTYYTGWTNDLKKRFHDHVRAKEPSIQISSACQSCLL